MTCYAPPEGSHKDSHAYGLMSGALKLAAGSPGLSHAQLSGGAQARAGSVAQFRDRYLVPFSIKLGFRLEGTTINTFPAPAEAAMKDEALKTIRTAVGALIVLAVVWGLAYRSVVEELLRRERAAHLAAWLTLKERFSEFDFDANEKHNV